MDPRRLKILYVFAGLLLTSSAAAQQSQPADGGLTLQPYADPAFGFELQVPAGWQYDRSRFQQFKDSIGLLRGIGPGDRQALQILVFRSFPMRPFEDWLVDFGKALSELVLAERIDWETWRLPPRAGAIFSYTSRLGGGATQSHCLCLPFDPNTVWVLIYQRAARGTADCAQVRAEFGQIINTLHVLYDPAQAEQLAPAFERGTELLQRLRDQADQVQLDDAEYYYELLLDHKPVGFMTRRIWRDEYVFSSPEANRRFAKDGVRMQERSWRFGDDGTARYSHLDAFSSFDLRSEVVEYQQVHIPAPDVPDAQPLIKTDQVIREDEVLVSSFTTSLDKGLPNPRKPIEVGPVYLDLAWVRLLPGLLLSGNDEPRAFAIYNTETRSLVQHLITPQGEKKLPEGGESAYVFAVREGFMRDPAYYYTDRRGNLLRLEAGDLIVRRLSAADVERRYGPRRDAAKKRYHRLWSP